MATIVNTGAGIVDRYGHGRSRLSEDVVALFKRHLLSDAEIARSAAGPSEKFEAAAPSTRDVLAQRWVQTQDAYDQADPKRIYYLSMEFLIGRSLNNDVTNLMLHPYIARAESEREFNWSAVVDQEPDAGLGMAASGGLPPAFSTRWRR